MIECATTRPLLALSAGGDLDASDAASVEAHVDCCPSCRLELSRFSGLIAQARIALPAGLALPDGVRKRIALEAAAQAGRRPWPFALPLLTLPVGRSGLLAAAAAVLVALVAVPLALRNRPIATAGNEVTNIQVVATGGEVRLAWSDGIKPQYTVLKTTDPRDHSRGEVHVVRGNVWTDTDPESARIVFYKID
jgi:anti-sigma factor RsiW